MPLPRSPSDSAVVLRPPFAARTPSRAVSTGGNPLSGGVPAPEALPFRDRASLFEELSRRGPVASGTPPRATPSSPFTPAPAPKRSSPCPSPYARAPSPDANWYPGSRVWGASTSAGQLQPQAQTPTHIAGCGDRGPAQQDSIGSARTPTGSATGAKAAPGSSHRERRHSMGLFVGTPGELQHLAVATSSRCLLRTCISSPCSPGPGSLGGALSGGGAVAAGMAVASGPQSYLAKARDVLAGAGAGAGAPPEAEARPGGDGGATPGRLLAELGLSRRPSAGSAVRRLAKPNMPGIAGL
ncbi:hypothetical protein HYH03_003574 [Edaphochlamys debaryana]|uniref:Uncharacterized protein n=1 Tax=Edaphochlamys debaryana TaxID=47281 RepID=A0A836C3Z0_9CHLO|nr:hypothetical protein HYH03_003574 [Edaphochlamys debaryana]|eukprot:KAG2498313.1 hypothetical protein HYH03_003574 [Edaphochlamys debaryana]